MQKREWLMQLTALCASAFVSKRASAQNAPQIDKPALGRYTSERRAYLTNSYWIEGRDGLVLIDAQFLPSDALKFVERAERETGKPVKLAVVLHPNPDKFNGTVTLQARGIKVITSEQVAGLICRKAHE